jgi:hypothetical protein
MYETKDSIVKYLKTEKQVYENMLQFLENYERGLTSIDLKPIEDLLSMLESIDLSSNSDFTNKRLCQSAIFLNRILADLIYLTRHSSISQEAKRKWISKLENLLERSEKLIRSYYNYYGYLPKYFRYYYYWYDSERRRYSYLPYYPPNYYYEKYPAKYKELSDTDVIWKDITTKQSRETSLFVPKSFGCDDGSQYDEYIFLQLYEALEDKPKKILPLDNSDQDALHIVADKIISETKQIMKQRSGSGRNE